MTSGRGMLLKDIAAEVGVSPQGLSKWQHGENFKEFQDALQELNQARWEAAEDAARQAAIELCKEKNAKFVEFVMKNIGYNPANKVEADVKTDISITIGEDEDAED